MLVLQCKEAKTEAYINTRLQLDHGYQTNIVNATIRCLNKSSIHVLSPAQSGYQSHVERRPVGSTIPRVSGR